MTRKILKLTDEKANIISEYDISPHFIKAVKDGVAKFTFGGDSDLETDYKLDFE